MHCHLRRQSFWALGQVTTPVMHQLTNSTRDVSAVFLVKFILCMHINCYLRAFRQNSDSTVGFGDPDLIYDMDILAIGEHLPYDLDF